MSWPARYADGCAYQRGSASQAGMATRGASRVSSRPDAWRLSGTGAVKVQVHDAMLSLGAVVPAEHLPAAIGGVHPDAEDATSLEHRDPKQGKF